MSFEDHIRENKDEFKLKSVDSELWERIDADLEIEPKKRLLNQKAILIISGLVLVVFLAFYFFQNKAQNELLEETKQELFALKTTMSQLLDNESSIKRIKAVSLSNSMEVADPEIIQIMISTMQNDEDESVKLAAVNALEEYAHMEVVKHALIEALEASDKAFFKIKIINILTELKEERALPLLDQIIDDNGSHGYLKEEAISARNSLKSL